MYFYIYNMNIFLHKTSTNEFNDLGYLNIDTMY